MDKIYSLHQLVSVVEGTFYEMFSEFEFMFTAEVGKIKDYGSRYYVDLFEYGTGGVVKAKVTGVVWSKQVLLKFLSSTGLTIETVLGKELLMSGTCTFSAQWGFSISIDTLSVEYELGKQKKHKDDILTKLSHLGIIQGNKSLGAPMIPLSIAVISSAQSEGLRDFITIIQDSGWNIGYTLFESTVEGDKARLGVKKCLETILQQPESFSCICIVRGGGGKEGMERQNDFDIAQLICKAKIPVISAVGHTADSSVLDEIVYYSSKTPSDAAYFLVEIYSNYDVLIQKYLSSISFTVSHKFAIMNERLQTWIQGVETCVKNKHGTLSTMIEVYYKSIQSFSPEFLLAKGYSIIYDSPGGKILTQSELRSLKKGDSITIISSKKIIDSSIDNIKNR